MSIIKYVTLQKIVAHDFRYVPRIFVILWENLLEIDNSKNQEGNDRCYSGSYKCSFCGWDRRATERDGVQRQAS